MPGSYEFEAFDLRGLVDDVSVEWLTENIVALNGDIQFENVNLGGDFLGQVGWFLDCGDGPLNFYNEVILSTLLLTSRPEPGFAPELTSELLVEPLTSVTAELPPQSIPITGAECADANMVLALNAFGNFDVRDPGVDGVASTDNFDATGYVQTGIDPISLAEGLGRFEQGGRVARSDFCEALIAQNLESLYDQPVVDWTESATARLYPSCKIATTSLFISNSPVTNEAIVGQFLGNRYPEGTSNLVLGSANGLVNTGDVLVYFSDDVLDGSKLETLGRLIGRILDQLLEDS